MAAHQGQPRRTRAKIKAALARRRRVLARAAGASADIMQDNGLASAYGRKFKCHPQQANEARAAQKKRVGRQFGEAFAALHPRVQRPHLRAGRRRLELRLPAGRPGRNREIVGHSAGPRKDADLVRSAFATLGSPYRHPGFHTDRGSGSTTAKIDRMPQVFGIAVALQRRAAPTTKSASTGRRQILKAEFVYREAFATTRGCGQHSDYDALAQQFQAASTLGYTWPQSSSRKTEFGHQGIVQIGTANLQSRRARARGRRPARFRR